MKLMRIPLDDSGKNDAEILQLTEEILRDLPPNDGLRREAQFRRGTGCDQCNQTGFSGRMPVSELLVVGEPFREAVLKKVPTLALEEIAIQQGMRTLWQNGLRRVIAGETPLEEAIKVVAADMV